MALGGYANRVGWIDLTNGAVEYKSIDEDDARKYIGGRGLGVKYVFDNGHDVDPLSPDNILCFMNGPLTGTEANMSGRMAVVTKSPLTGTVTDSHHGGWSAARLRWAGFDGLVFKGKAEGPVYAYVEDGQVELKDASDLWGKGVRQTVEILQERHGNGKQDDISVIAIGQAGENLVKFASWINEHDRASGRGGTGCVGGSKNLKAIVIKADKKMPQPADREAWNAAHKQALATIMDEANVTAPRKGGLSVYGTNVLMNIVSDMGALPAKNSQLASFGEKAELISGEWVKENILVNDPTCHACPVACKKEVDTSKGNGKYNVHMESTEYESMWALGANCDLADSRAIAVAIDMCNDLGMDTIEMGNALAVAMEATERGLISEGIAWGDADAMLELIRKIALREGIGDDLAEGPARAAEKWGSTDISMNVKRQSIPAYDPRGLKGMGIGYATSNRGACHLRGYTPGSEILGVGGKTDPLAWEGKGKLLKLFQDLHAVSDSFDICKFSAFAEGIDEYTAQYNAMLGTDLSPEELLKCGERVYNLERYYNNLNGFDRKDDSLPKRFLTEPSQAKGSEGHVCELDQMLDEYYEARGWVDGVVPEEKLRELEIIA